MIIEQKPKFQPITIVLETAEEAEEMWEALRIAEGCLPTERTKKMCIKISDWFSNNAQLGG